MRYATDLMKVLMGNSLRNTQQNKEQCMKTIISDILKQELPENRADM